MLGSLFDEETGEARPAPLLPRNRKFHFLDLTIW